MNENLTWRWKQSGQTDFCKIRALFSIFKKGGGGLFLLLSCVPVDVAKYISLSLNIRKYLYNVLNKLFWLCQGSEFAWSSYVFDRLLKMPRILNVSEFWIWQFCICKGNTEFWICLNIAQYSSIRPEHVSACLYVPQCAWALLSLLNVPEYALKCLNKLFWSCQSS